MSAKHLAHLEIILYQKSTVSTVFFPKEIYCTEELQYFSKKKIFFCTASMRNA
jgi:hypothetical protein